ncbi:MAG: flagellar hook-basal body complex protein FliE [Erythrobacter sp.]
MSAIRPGFGPGFGPADVMALRNQVLARSAALQELRAAGDAARAAGPAPAPAAGFADTLGNALKQVNAVQQRSSEMQVAYERGQVTDIAQVMLARQEAGVAFEATLQVRNKLLTAYQDIMRMGG